MAPLTRILDTTIRHDTVHEWLIALAAGLATYVVVTVTILTVLVLGDLFASLSIVLDKPFVLGVPGQGGRLTAGA
jgi:hypothetical protein